jgi:hypothetical protein
VLAHSGSRSVFHLLSFPVISISLLPLMISSKSRRLDGLIKVVV